METNQTIDITAEERETVLTLLQRHLPGVEAWAHGSRAKSTAHPQSDLDLVVFAPPEQSHKISDLREALEESNLPFRVDLFIWDDIPDTFRESIREQHIKLMRVHDTASSSMAATRPIAAVGDASKKIGNWLFYPSFPAHWQRQSLYSMATWINGLAFRNIQFSDTGLPVVKIAEIKRGISGQTKFTEQVFDESVLIKSGDLLFSWSGQPETSINAFRWRGPEGWLNQHIFRVIPIEGIDNNFFFYLLRYLKPNFIGIARNKQTTGLGHVTKRDLENLETARPPLPEQRTISHILGTLDDKIELNRRMNETLEAIAQTLFKSWFIDFDPVRAKMTLKQHHSPPQHHSPLEGESNPQSGFGGGNNDQAPDSDPPPALRRANALVSPTPPQGGSDWTVKRLYPEKTLNRAKSLRYNQTDAERLLWHYLRNKQLDGYKFRRQQPVGPYIVDFACLPEKLLIELDGGQHAEQETYDEQRDQFLQSQGYRVLRFWNNEVFDNCFAVLEQIYQTLINHSPLEGESNPQSGFGGGYGREHGEGNNDQATNPDLPPPHQSSPDGSPSATPPQGGSDWTIERARAYLDRMDPEIAALFPDKLVDSELGEIPEGWEIQPISSLADCVGGATPSTKNPAFWESGTIMWATPKDLSDSNSVHLSKTGRKITELGLSKISSGLLPVGTVLLSSRAPVGYLAITVEPTAINQGFIALKPMDSISGFYLFNWCSENLEAIKNRASGTTFAEISKKSFRPIPTIRPPDKLVSYFHSLVTPTYEKLLINDRESQAFLSMRDTLLPKLISGEIRLPDMRKFTETSQ